MAKTFEYSIIPSCNMKYILGIFFLSVISVLILSTSTSFLFSYREQLDSIVYQIIGREWLNGVLPYRDLWDLKGPMIFFINALGYLFTGSRYGILIFQILFLFASLIIVFFYFRKVASEIKSLAGVVIICFTLATVYEGGNMVEEYILPFIFSSFICMNSWLKNLKNGVAAHKWQFAFIYGITFAFAFLTRLTNALPLCAGIAYVSIMLICKNEWKNFLYNIIAFIIGAILIILPFVVYFYLTNSLQDYIVSIEFCYKYLVKSSQIIDIKKIFLFNFPVFLLIALSIINFLYERNWNKLFFWLIVCSVSLYWVFSSRGFNHYSIIFLPYMAIALYEIMLHDVRFQRIAFVVVFLFILRGVKHDVTYYRELDDVVKSNLVMSDMMDKVPFDERSNTLIYCDVIAPYLYQNICPAKYFYLQDVNARISSAYKDKMLEDFIRVSPKYVITGVSADAVKTILESQYQVFCGNPFARIYKKIDRNS